ncbi:MAG TPA: cytidine deaminase [Flavipsychrobacter sp.]|nr:cytidine deaminase [Flavipsychrobacter sp.]
MDSYTFPYQQYLKAELPADMQQLVEAAEAATKGAYAPYSNLKVGASILMEDGNIVTGFNQENAAFPVGICAERAILSTIDLAKGTKIKAIAVTYSSDNNQNEKPIAPCGMCRQSILEMQQRQQAPIAVYMCSPKGLVIMIENAEFLLPFSFGSDDLPTYKPQV